MHPEAESKLANTVVVLVCSLLSFKPTIPLWMLPATKKRSVELVFISRLHLDTSKLLVLNFNI